MKSIKINNLTTIKKIIPKQNNTNINIPSQTENTYEELDFDQNNQYYDNCQANKENSNNINNLSYSDSEKVAKVDLNGFNFSDKYSVYHNNLNKYDSFLSCMTDNYINIPFDGSNFVPQGSCQAGEYTLIVGYDSNGSDNSTLYVMDSMGQLCNVVQLDANYHCGAVSYDESTNSVYITGRSEFLNKDVCYVNQYSLNEILEYDPSESEYFFGMRRNKTLKANQEIMVDNDNSFASGASDTGISSCAYLNVSNGYLYTGNFPKGDVKGIIKKRKINSDGSLGEETIINNPFEKTQGMCVYNHDGVDYYLFSCSYGRKNDSSLHVATLNQSGEFQEVGKMDLPCMSEQISVCDKGLSIVFESGANKYSDATSNIEDVCYLDPITVLNTCGVNTNTTNTSNF